MTSTGEAEAAFSSHVPKSAGLFSDTESPAHRRVVGTVLFTDVSGFTKLSEGLARRGREGAEVVTEVISTIFERLLDAAFSEGGDLITFGGDSLLLLFLGVESRERAIRASNSMQSALAETSVSAGRQRLRLKMSAGLATGPVDLYKAGERHWELVVAGPAVDQALAFEGRAKSGHVVTSDSDDTGSETVPTLFPVDASRWIPEPVRDSLLTGAGPDHRVVTVGFAKLRAPPDSDNFRHALHEVVVAIDDLAERFGVALIGTDVAIGAVKLILASGAPVARGDHEERLLRFAREAIDGGLPLSFGVTTGNVFSGEIGGTRRVYTVMGDTVNLAARLMEHAEPGDVLTTARVLDRTKIRFHVEPRVSVDLKGKSKPLVPLAVQAIADHREQTDLPLIGRREELGLLRASLDEASDGAGNVVEITAPPGAGKSRLVAEFAKRAGVPVITAVSEEYGSDRAYGVLRAILSNITGEETESVLDRLRLSAPSLERWLPLLAPVLGVEVEETAETEALAAEFRVQRLHTLIGDLLESLLEGPHLLVLEDTHWMDPASVSALESVLNRVWRTTWVIVLTRRPKDEGLKLAEEIPGLRIELPPLTKTDTQRLLNILTDQDPLLPDDANTMVERAAGNPLFLIGLAEDRSEDLPETLEATVAARIDRLPPSDRHLLRRLAVAGPRITPNLARILAPEAETELKARPELDEFLVAGDDGTLRFRHALFRDVAYEALPYTERRRLHAIAGEEVERTGHLELSAGVASRHFELAGRWQEAFERAVLAGELAAETYATREAIDFHRRALRAARYVRGIPTSKVAKVGEALGDLLERAGRHAEAAKAFRTARRKIDEPSWRARLMMKEGMTAEQAGKYSAALRWLTRASKALDEADEDDTHMRAEIAVARAGVRFRQDRYRDTVRWCDHAIALAESVGLKSVLAHGFYLRGHVRSLLDPSTTHDDDHIQALEIYEELNDLIGQASVHNNLGLEAYYRGDWAEAIEHHHSSEELRRRAGDTTRGAASAFNRSLVLFDQGHLEEAKEVLQDVRRVGVAARVPLIEGASLCYLAAISGRRGSIHEAESMFADSLRLLEPIGAEFFLNDIHLKRSEVRLLAGDVRSAEEEALEGLAATENKEGMEASTVGFHRMVAATRWLDRDVNTAVTHIEQGLITAERHNLQYEVALLSDGLATCVRARGGEAAPLLARRDEILARLGVVEHPRWFST
jgi:class 3 adenylate cyclase/tetratricopeptide (TPR) repeat protein